MKAKSSKSGKSDNPVWSDADFKRAKRVEDIPELAHLTKRRPGERGPQKAATKEAISIRLDRDLVAYYRSLGEGWQVRMNTDLRTMSGIDGARKFPQGMMEASQDFARKRVAARKRLKKK